MAQKLLTRKQRRRRKILIGVGIFLILGIIATLLYTSIFRMTGTEVTGAKHTDIVALQHDIEPLIHGYSFLMIPNDDIFLYRKGKLKDFILKTYPSVESLDMHIDTSRKLVIHIKDRKPLGVWCGTECYLYDTAGVVFKKSFTYTGALFVSWQREGSSTISLLDTVSCESLCTDPVFMEFLKKYKIEKAVLHENLLELTSSDGFMIKAGFDASTTMAHIHDIEDSKPDFLKSLEYVDVRFDNKVFYKERGGVSADTGSSTVAQ